MVVLYYNLSMITRGYNVIKKSMDHVTKKIGQNIKNIRLSKGITQLVLATKLDADKSYVSKLENGKFNPTINTLEKIANVLSVSIKDLI